MGQGAFTRGMVLAASALCGCGPSSTTHASGDGGSATTVPDAGPIPESLGPAAIAQAICNKVQRCGCNWATSASCVSDDVCDPGTCVSQYTSMYQQADMAATGMGEVYVPERSCVDAIAAADCNDVDYVNLCATAWNGTQSEGEPCNATQACETTDAASPLTCSAAGICAPDTAGGAAPTMGQACSGTCLGDSCDIFTNASGGQCQHMDGLACIDSVCQPLLTSGEACSSQFQCSDPLECIGAVCATPVANGATCVTPNDDDDNPCASGSGCVSGVCAVLKADGQACSVAAQCLENNCIGGECVRIGAVPICGN
jgi:hypothetical protein